MREIGTGRVGARAGEAPAQQLPEPDAADATWQTPAAAGRWRGSRYLGLARALVWCLGAAGWVVAAVFILYSHGESDRVRDTRHATATQVASMSAALGGALAVQHYLSTTSSTRVVVLSPLDRRPGAASATFLFGAGKLGAIVVDGLPAAPPGHFYAVWVRGRDRSWRLGGTVTPAIKGAEASGLVAAPRPLNQYSSVSLDLESRIDVPTPSHRMLFTAKL